jgi:hypothetical protein
MRRILLVNARRHTAVKRGSGGQKVSLDEVATVSRDGARRKRISISLPLVNSLESLVESGWRER